MWIHPRTEPRIPDPGSRVAVVRCSRGLVACLGPDPAPSPWGFVSGVGAQTGREWVVDGNCSGLGSGGSDQEIWRQENNSWGSGARGVWRGWRLGTRGGVQPGGAAARLGRRAVGRVVWSGSALRPAIARRGAWARIAWSAEAAAPVVRMHGHGWSAAGPASAVAGTTERSRLCRRVVRHAPLSRAWTCWRRRAAAFPTEAGATWEPITLR